MFTKAVKNLLLMLTVVSLILVVGGCQKAVDSGAKESNTQGEVKQEEPKQEEGKDAEPSKLDEIKKRGKIVLGTSADWPPYEFHKEINGEDTIVGFDIDIAKQIAKDLGVEIEIKDMKFDGLLAALVAGKVDFVAAGLTPTPEREKSVDFSIGYYQGIQKILVRTENADKIKSVEDLKGLIIGAQKATTQEELALNNIPGAKIKSLSKITDLVIELKNKKIDGIVLVEPVANAYAKRNADLTVPDITLADANSMSIAVNEGNTELLNAINASLQKMLDEGKVDEFITNATELAEQE